MLDHEIKDILTKLIISIVIGLVIGGEREYRNKSAGLRTLILICLGSTIFTILSGKIGDDASGASRVAANIVTGIGFLGAGAIMREGLTITGLTTASTIWVGAALGMAVGAGEYKLAIYCMIITFSVLTLFENIQQLIFKFFKKKIGLHLTMRSSGKGIEILEDEMKRMGLRYERRKEFRKKHRALYEYDVIGKEAQLNTLVSFLNKSELVKSFNY